MVGVSVQPISNDVVVELFRPQKSGTSLSERVHVLLVETGKLALKMENSIFKLVLNSVEVKT